MRTATARADCSGFPVLPTHRQSLVSCCVVRSLLLLLTSIELLDEPVIGNVNKCFVSE